jgi:Domain of unknown function (DUF4157)
MASFAPLLRKPLPPQPKLAPKDRTKPAGADLAGIVKRGFAAPAQPLPLQARAALEKQLGGELARVRVHRGPQAAAAAEDLHASAFTVGRDIVLGEETRLSSGDPTLRHEVAHAVQQRLADRSAAPPTALTDPGGPVERDARSAERGAAPSLSSVPVVARQTAGLGASTNNSATAGHDVVPPFSRPWAEAWKEFYNLTGSAVAIPSPRSALVARELITNIGSAAIPDKVAHGPDLIAWLLANNMADEATRISGDVRDAWLIAKVTATPGSRALPPINALFGAALGSPLDALVTQGQALAGAGQDDRAIEILGSAYQLLQFQLVEQGPARERDTQSQAMTNPATGLAALTRLSVYGGGQHNYDQMRKILGTYDELARRARAAGKTAEAARLSAQSAKLRAAIATSYGLRGEEMMTAEVQDVTNAQGRDALRIFGANDVNVDVTQLPGLPPPREVGGASAKNAITYQWSTSEETTKALAAQTVFLDELHQEPKIEAAFGNRDVDMNDTNTRLRIWSIMFDVYAQKSGNGLPDLMALIGRYLAAYTVHTGYNVPDFGESYLDKNEGTMPSDLAGRLERDCGVYALTVAYEVYRTARGVKLPVTFRVWTTPDHASLVIRDDRAHQFYVVNNNQVSVARGFDPANPNAVIRGEVAKAYAPIRGHTFTVSPAMDVEIGSTALTDAQFRAQAWSRYQLAAGWTVEQFPTYQGHQPGEDSFYAYQADASLQFAQIDASLANLSRDLRAAPSNDQLAIFNGGRPGRPGIADIRAALQQAQTMFDQLGPRAPQSVTPGPDQVQRLNTLTAMGASQFLRASPGAHPVARLGMALLRFQAVGGQLTASDLSFLSYCDRLFGGDMNAYRAAGSTATF